jgi:hypothetical protein
MAGRRLIVGIEKDALNSSLKLRANRAQTMRESPKLPLQQTQQPLGPSGVTSLTREFWEIPNILVWLCIVLITGRQCAEHVDWVGLKFQSEE